MDAYTRFRQSLAGCQTFPMSPLWNRCPRCTRCYKARSRPTLTSLCGAHSGTASPRNIGCKAWCCGPQEILRGPRSTARFIITIGNSAFVFLHAGRVVCSHVGCVLLDGLPILRMLRPDGGALFVPGRCESKATQLERVRRRGLAAGARSTKNEWKGSHNKIV